VDEPGAGEQQEGEHVARVQALGGERLGEREVEQGEQPGERAPARAADDPETAERGAEGHRDERETRRPRRLLLHAEGELARAVRGLVDDAPGRDGARDELYPAERRPRAVAGDGGERQPEAEGREREERRRDPASDHGPTVGRPRRTG
jgi:hypothetical protein